MRRNGESKYGQILNFAMNTIIYGQWLGMKEKFCLCVYFLLFRWENNSIFAYADKNDSVERKKNNKAGKMEEFLEDAHE